ncbi:MAG: hypothetical protein JWP91_3023 [Fibrobacteres bacterium]|nr:hypothetical protein [Fibrobacterota bacterium]
MSDSERILKLVDAYKGDKGGQAGEAALNQLLAASDEELGYLFFPSEKSKWEAAAEILYRIGFPRLTTRIPQLLEWFQDLNWPGIDVITNLLRNVSHEELLMQMEKAVRIAHAEEDEQWIGGLKRLTLTLGLDADRFSDPLLTADLLKNVFY